MPGKKRKRVIDLKEVAAYRKKLRRPAGTPLKLTNRERKTYTFKAPFPQSFSLPPNILRYIARNPTSPNGHLKLLSTCKALLRISRILPVKRLTHYYKHDCNKWFADKESLNLKNQFLQLWIHDQLDISTQSLPNLASTLVNRAYKFSLRSITIQNQVLTFQELQILVAGGHLEFVESNRNVIHNPDGTVTDFEKVFELLCCKKVRIFFRDEEHGIGTSTTGKIIEILSSDQLPVEQNVDLWNVPRNFDFRLFSKFLKANMTGRQHSFFLEIGDDMFDAFKQELEQFVNELIQTRGIYSHTIPLICFPDQDVEEYNQLWRMRHGHVEGILQKPN